MIPAFDVDAPHCRFLGFPMQQNRFTVPAWSYLIERLRPKQFVEIGCWKGGLSCALAVAMSNFGGNVFCYDSGTFDKDLQKWLDILPVEFVSLDVFSDAGTRVVASKIVQAGTSIVLCDNGNKPREFSIFAPFLKPGDIIAAHDFAYQDLWPWTEITEKQIERICAMHKLHPFMQDVFAPAGWLVKRKEIRGEWPISARNQIP